MGTEKIDIEKITWKNEMLISVNTQSGTTFFLRTGRPKNIAT